MPYWETGSETGSETTNYSIGTWNVGTPTPKFVAKGHKMFKYHL